MKSLQFKKITADYGQMAILQEIDIAFEQGKLHGIIGANGSGKSTLLKTVLKLANCRSGSILIGNRKINPIPTYRLGRGLISALPQRTFIYPSLSIKENINASVAWFNRQERNNSIKYGLELWRSIFPEVKLSMQASLLSVGESRCLGIVCCLCRPAEWYLLDEPTAGLDDFASNNIFNWCKLVAGKGKGLIIVEQRLNFVTTYCDTSSEIHNGKIYSNL